jgi:flagellar basal-body rod protein FlgB
VRNIRIGGLKFAGGLSMVSLNYTHTLNSGRQDERPLRNVRSAFDLSPIQTGADMGIDFGKALGVHGQALQLRAERTRVIAENIANQNTPGYQARDVDFSSSLRQAMAGEGGGLSLDSEGGETLYRVPYHAAQDGNTVELGVEQAAFSQNTSDFQISLTFANMKLKGLAKAIAGQ